MADEADLGGGGIMFMVGGLAAVTVAFGFLVVGVGDLAKLSPNIIFFPPYLSFATRIFLLPAIRHFHFARGSTKLP
jgi:hypothetical protein